LFWTIGVTFQEKGGGGFLHALFFVILMISIFFTKQSMSSNQVERKIIKQAHEGTPTPS
jgi:uncharacterized membrane protein